VKLLGCRVHRPKYPSKSPLFLGSLDRLRALFYAFACWGCWNTRTALPLAWRLSNSYPQHSAGGRGFTVCPLEKALQIVLQVMVDGLFFDGSLCQYQQYVGIHQNEFQWLHDAPSSDKSMPSLSPSDGIAPTYGAHIRAISTAIMVIGLPCSTNNPGNIVPPRILLPDNFVAVSLDDIFVLLPPSATCWGSTTPLTSLTQPLEHSPCPSVTFGSMGGEYTLTTRPTMPLEGAPQTGCPSSLAQPSLPARLTTHLLLSNPPPPPTGQGGCSPTHTLLTVGESAALAESRANDQGLQRLAFLMSSLRHADAHP
jgi:hypothetical protein